MKIGEKIVILNTHEQPQVLHHTLARPRDSEFSPVFPSTVSIARWCRRVRCWAHWRFPSIGPAPRRVVALHCWALNSLSFPAHYPAVVWCATLTLTSVARYISVGLAVAQMAFLPTRIIFSSLTYLFFCNSFSALVPLDNYLLILITHKILLLVVFSPSCIYSYTGGIHFYFIYPLFLLLFSCATA